MAFKLITTTSIALHNDCRVARWLAYAEQELRWAGACMTRNEKELKLFYELLPWDYDTSDAEVYAFEELLRLLPPAANFPADELDIAFCGCAHCASARLAHAESVYQRLSSSGLTEALVERQVRDELAALAALATRERRGLWEQRASSTIYGRSATSAWRESAQELFDMLGWR